MAKKIFILILTIGFSFFIKEKLYSQVVPGFTFNVTNVCAPVNISFTNTTTGCSGSATYSWQSGAGDISTLANPTFTYSIGGTYTVSLTVTCGGSDYIVQQQIVVYNGPNAAFSNGQQIGCKPFNTSFSDLSTSGDAAISSWTWYFGDGNSSFQQNPSHTYNTAGIYTVTLSVTDANSCTKQYVEEQIITVSDVPSVSFTASQTEHCTPPLVTTFTANVNTALGLGYNLSWNFSGGTPAVSTALYPTITYNANGNYNVSLTVTDAAGCTNTISENDFISIMPIQASYYIDNNRDTACKNENIQIFNGTSYFCLWTYNGNQTSTLNTLIVGYPNSGTYPITLTIDPGGACQADTTFNICIENITAGFTNNITEDFYCSAPLHSVFINTSSSNAVVFNYTFGNNISSSAENPVIDFSSGTYQPVLIVTSANGCTSTFVGDSFTVVGNSIGFAVDGNHCVPSDLSFEYSGFSFPVSDVVSSIWDFGNGTIINPGNENETVTYSQPGDYFVSLSVTSTDGCIINYSDTVHIGTHYIPTIGIMPNANICPQDTVKLLLTDDHSACGNWCNYEYTWLIINSLSDTAVINYDGPETEHFFDKDTGWVHIGIITNHNSCIDTIVMEDSVYINFPVIWNITQEFESCQNSKNYEFTVSASGADIYDWNIYQFDTFNNPTDIYSQNGITNSVLQYNFLAAGSYWLRVTAYNNSSGCEYIDSIQVTVAEAPLAVISPLANDTICLQTNILFGCENSQNYQGGISWNFGDGTTATNQVSVSHLYEAAGNYVVTLIISNTTGCSDTATLEFVIAGVSIGISAVDNYGCQDLHTIFTNTSVSNDGMQLVLWTFHDNSNQTGNTATYDYSGVGTYSVMLSIVTNHGCFVSGFFPNYVVITELSPNFSVSQTQVCAGQNVVFTAEEHSSYCTYFWNFGDGTDSTTTVPQVSHLYENGGNYNVILHIENIYDCQTDMFIPNMVYVEKIEADFMLSEDVFVCYPAEIQLYPTITTNSPSLEYYWEMGNGGVSIVENPAYVYSQPGTYNITFIPTTALNCSDTVVHQVVVHGPYADMLVSKNSICIGDSVLFQISNAIDVDEFLWVLGSGYSSTDSSFYQTYNNITPQGFVQISLTLRSFYGQDTCEVYLSEIIYIHRVIADFNILDENQNEIIGICSPINAYFTDNSENAAALSWFINGAFFGNGNTVENYYEENNSQLVVTNTITLVATHAEGCIDTVSKEMLIYPIPIAEVSNDTLICEDDTVQIFVSHSNNYSYFWSPNYNISDIDVYNPTVYPPVTTSYIVVVRNTQGCENSDTVTVTVRNHPILNFDQSTVNIIVGEYVDFVVTEVANTDNVSYSWEPNYRITCLNCLNQTVQPLHDVKYTLIVTDANGCFEDRYDKNIIVREIFTIGVPTAFTPLSDDANNVVYVNGHGIKKLKQFRIYDRWGQEIFYTEDISKGWDGTFKGKVQNVDNYGYFVEAEMYNNETQIKKGVIMLIK